MPVLLRIHKTHYRLLVYTSMEYLYINFKMSHTLCHGWTQWIQLVGVHGYTCCWLHACIASSPPSHFSYPLSAAQQRALCNTSAVTRPWPGTPPKWFQLSATPEALTARPMWSMWCQPRPVCMLLTCTIPGALFVSGSYLARAGN